MGEEVGSRGEFERVRCLPAGLSVQWLRKGGQHIGLKLDFVRVILKRAFLMNLDYIYRQVM